MTHGRATDRRRLPALLAAAGLLLSLILAAVHAATYLAPARESFCSSTGAFDCASVAASRYSVFLGLPWALWGVVGFSAILTAALRRSKWLLPLSAGAAVTSAGLLAISLLQIGHLCLLCEGVHLLSFALLGVALKNRARLGEEWGDRAGLQAVALFPFLLAVAFWFAVPPYWKTFSYRGEPTLQTGLTDDGHHFIGAVKPRVTIHEFTDYVCPHCKAATAHSMRLIAKYPDVRLVRHDNPRTSCQGSPWVCQASRAALCADAQGRFWQADRWLFVFADARKRLDTQKFIRDVRLDPGNFDECYSAKETYEKAGALNQYARKKRARFVPTYLIDGRRVEAADLEARISDQ